MLKKIIYVFLFVGLGFVAYYFSPMSSENRLVNDLIERNMDARGGEEAWDKVNSLRLSGRMEIGQGTHVPYTLEQQRPLQMCIEFIFAGQKTMQCSNGKQGWKVVPFRGRTNVELLSEKEFKEGSDAADLYGLLAKPSNNKIEYISLEQISDRETHKLKITLPKGGVRWLYIDNETALEVKLETLRIVGGKERVVTTLYSDWKSVDGLLISHRQDSKTEGEEKSHFMTVESAEINPKFSDSRFVMPDISSENSGSGK